MEVIPILKFTQSNINVADAKTPRVTVSSYFLPICSGRDHHSRDPHLSERGAVLFAGSDRGGTGVIYGQKRKKHDRIKRLHDCR